jgi:hypothetical protein
VLFASIRRGAAALAIIGLAACAGQSSMVPSQSTQPMQSLIAQGLSSTHLAPSASLFSEFAPDKAASPCKALAAQHFWDFTGPCGLVPIKAAGMKITLSAFKGITVNVAVQKSNSKNEAFIVADGTGSADITGTFANTKFINYGTVPCVTPAGKTTPCKGKGLVYVLLLNTTKTAVEFTALPSLAVATKTFPGTKSCQYLAMGFLKGGIPGGWFLLPSTGKPKSGSVTLPAPAGAYTLGATSFTVVGVSCQ